VYIYKTISCSIVLYLLVRGEGAECLVVYSLILKVSQILNHKPVW
jgi:hypothetical protein